MTIIQFLIFLLTLVYSLTVRQPDESTVPADIVADYPAAAEAQKAIQNKNYKQALRLCFQATDSVWSQFLIAYMYDNGLGVDKNSTEAALWYDKAARQGAPHAQFMMGVKCENGDGVEQSYEEAARWYQLAAGQGQPEAMCNLGHLYECEKGVELSFAQAFECYRKAAEQGLPMAQFNLARMYASGAGVTQNYSLARLNWAMGSPCSAAFR